MDCSMRAACAAAIAFLVLSGLAVSAFTPAASTLGAPHATPSPSSAPGAGGGAWLAGLSAAQAVGAVAAFLGLLGLLGLVGSLMIKRARGEPRAAAAPLLPVAERSLRPRLDAAALLQAIPPLVASPRGGLDSARSAAASGVSPLDSASSAAGRFTRATRPK
jgi:hypothetical protein